MTMKKWLRMSLVGMIVLGVLSAGISMNSFKAAAATSGDAYANYDSVAGTWTMGTAQIEKVVTLSSGNFRMTSLYNKLTSRQMLQNSQTGAEFRIMAAGTSYNGNSGGWTLVSQASAVGAQGSVTQDITIRNTVLDVTLHYIIWPSTGVIEQSIDYKNRTASGYTINDPEILESNVMAADMASGNTTFYYFTGGRDTSDALHLQSDTTSSSWIRDLQSNHYGSEEYLQEVIYRRAAYNDGVLFGWSYASSWFARFNGNGTVQVDAFGANNTTLAAGATLKMALTHMMVFKGDLDDAGNALKDFQYRYKWEVTKDKWVGAVKPYLWNGGNSYDNNNTFNLTENYRHVGVDIWHWDADWYDKQGDWNNIKSTNMGQLNKFAKKNNMDMMVWMPVYQANTDSAVLTANPSWDTTITSCMYYPAVPMNLSIGAAKDWMLSKLGSKTTELGDWIWRQDFGGGSWDGSGVNQINASNNYFQLMADFKANNPNSGININHCGGRQMSVETFHYGDIVQTTDGVPGHYSVYTPSYLFPPDKYWGAAFVGGASWPATKVELRAKLASAWEWDGNGTPTLAQLEAYRENADIYHFMKTIGLAGRYVKMYHPEVGFDDKTYYVQRMSNDNTKGVIIPMHSYADPNGNLVRVYPKGLIPTLEYTVRFHNVGYQVSNTGAYWMTNGIGQANWGGDLVWLNVTNAPGAGTDTTAPGAPSTVIKKTELNMDHPGIALTWNSGTDNNWVSHYEIYLNGVYKTKVAKGNYAFISGGALGDGYTVRTVDGGGNKSGFITAATMAGYHASDSFSSTQGTGRWSYKQTSDLITYTNMTWDAANSRWQGTGYSILSQYWNHPDTTIKSARTWNAPTTGTIQITGNIAKGYTGVGGNGVNAKIMKNSTQIWPATGWQFIGGTNTIGVDINVTTSVTAGDNIYFVLDSNGSVSYDNTVWSSTVKY